MNRVAARSCGRSPRGCHRPCLPSSVDPTAREQLDGAMASASEVEGLALATLAASRAWRVAISSVSIDSAGVVEARKLQHNRTAKEVSARGDFLDPVYDRRALRVEGRLLVVRVEPPRA